MCNLLGTLAKLEKPLTTSETAFLVETDVYGLRKMQEGCQKQYANVAVKQDI